LFLNISEQKVFKIVISQYFSRPKFDQIAFKWGFRRKAYETVASVA